MGTKDTNLYTVSLRDGIAGGRGHYTDLSILDPSIRIERSAKKSPRDPVEKKDKSKHEEHYRVILSFKLQVRITGFDHQFVQAIVCWQSALTYPQG